MVEYIRIYPFSKYPADIHNVSLRTFVECTDGLKKWGANCPDILLSCKIKRHRWAKMEYYYPGTESYIETEIVVSVINGRVKFFRPSRWTGGNLGKNKKLCSLSCLFYHVQQNTSCKDNSKNSWLLVNKTS